MLQDCRSNNYNRITSELDKKSYLKFYIKF